MNNDHDLDVRLLDKIFLNTFEESGLWHLHNEMVLGDDLGPEVVERCRQLVREHVLRRHLVLYKVRSDDSLELSVEDAVRAIDTESSWTMPAQIEQGVFLAITPLGEAYLETIGWHRS